MLNGMTGFGSSEKGGFRVELRSLNHRFLEAYFRMPPALGAHEVPLRQLLKETFKRGRFESTVSVTTREMVSVTLNHEAAKEIISAFEELNRELGLSTPVSLDLLSGWRDLIFEEKVDYDTGALYEAFRDSAAQVAVMRKKEGEALSEDILGRIDTIERLNAEIIDMLPEALELARKKFMEKVRAIVEPENETERARLFDEACSKGEKIDISEETTRLKSHLAHVRSLIEKNDSGSVGRKLDFIVQELNRETNTIASKSESVEILNRALEMRSEIERIREQVQNVE